MGDSTPLLSESDSVHSSESLPQFLPPKPSPTFDDAIENYIGGSGKAQLLQAILVSLAWFFDAQQTFISVFTDAVPEWHYTTPSPPSRLGTAGCWLPAGSWDWDWPINTSIISEWALQCSGPIISGLPSSAFFMGCLVGGLVMSSLADSLLGRKNTLTLCCFVMSLASVLLAVFSANVWIYSGLKFVVGFGRAAVGSCALVLSTEIVARRWRGRVGIIGFLFFTLGFLSLPAIAYLNRGSSWRILYLWASLPAILYCVLIHFVVRESPRWLFIRGRKEEAVATLRSIADRSSLTLSFFDLPVEEAPEQDVDVYAALKVLVRKRWALRRLMTVMAVGFGLGVVYYAMPLAVGDLAFGNLYLSVAFNALTEVPAAALTFCLTGRMSRRTGVMVFCFASGACSGACAAMGSARWLQVGMQLASFFSACTAFNLLMIYAVELFPTSVRNSALSMARQAMVAGGVVGPAAVAVGRGNGFVSFVIFGAVIACCGAFAALLPETIGRTFYDTLDEEEHYNDVDADV